MTRDEALDFLRSHQPMPDDEALSEELIRRYDEVRRHFIDYPDARCIPLFLNSFGEGDGFGVYQLVEDVLTRFPSQEVIPHLLTALSNSSRSVRYWVAEIAASFPDEQLVRPLSVFLTEGDEDLIAASVIALGQIKSREARASLRSALDKCPSKYVRELIQRQLASIRETPRLCRGGSKSLTDTGVHRPNSPP
jgi:HEAT repeat protein